MIQEFATYTAKPTLRNSVLPRTAICGANRLAAHRLHGRDNIGTELCVPIEDQKALRLLVPLPGLVQLYPDPRRIGIARHVVVNDATAIMTNDEEAIQNAEGQRGHREKIHRCNRLPMIPQEGQPALCRVGWSWRPVAPSVTPLVPIPRSRASTTRHECAVRPKLDSP